MARRGGGIDYRRTLRTVCMGQKQAKKTNAKNDRFPPSSGKPYGAMWERGFPPLGCARPCGSLRPRARRLTALRLENGRTIPHNELHDSCECPQPWIQDRGGEHTSLATSAYNDEQARWAGRKCESVGLGRTPRSYQRSKPRPLVFYPCRLRRCGATDQSILVAFWRRIAAKAARPWRSTAPTKSSLEGNDLRRLPRARATLSISASGNCP